MIRDDAVPGGLPMTIRRLVEAAIQRVRPRRVILYGSRAKGTAHLRSDFDLAFDVPPDRLPEWRRFTVESVDEPFTLRAVDLVDLSEASSDLRAEIDRTGVLLYEG